MCQENNSDLRLYRVSAGRARALDVAVSQELGVLFAEQLIKRGLAAQPVLVEFVEDVLCNSKTGKIRKHCFLSLFSPPLLGLLGRGRAPKEIKGNIKPLVDVAVEGKVLVADLLAGQALLECLCLGGRAVLVRAANVERVVATEAAVAGVHVGREDASLTPNEINELRYKRAR